MDLHLYNKRIIYFLVNAKASSCLSKDSFAAKLAYQWEISPSSGINLPNTISPRLVIPAKELVGGRQYTVTCVVSMQQDSTLAVTQKATIFAQSSEVVAVISGVQTMSIAETLELSGGSSYDPDGNKANKKVSYTWDILNMDGSAVISRKDRNRIKLPKTETIRLAGRGNLELGKSYKFSLTYRVGRRVSTTEQVVNVIACETCTPPLVKITTTDKVVNPSGKVLIDAHIQSMNVTANYVWSVESVAEEDADGKLYGVIAGGLSEKHALTAVRGSFKGDKKIALKLKQSTLSGGVYYKLKLTVTDADGTAASNTYEIKTNSVPSQGDKIRILHDRI